MVTAQRQRILGATVDAAACKTCTESPTTSIVSYYRAILVPVARPDNRQMAGNVSNPCGLEMNVL